MGVLGAQANWYIKTAFSSSPNIQDSLSDDDFLR